MRVVWALSERREYVISTMRGAMRKIAAALALLFLAAGAYAQRAITFEDMAAIRRIGAPKVSPDGKWIAYDASTIDLAANARHSAIYLVPASGGESRKISDGT